MNQGFKLLPPRPGVCQQCGVEHPPDYPHNRDSLQYQYWFYGENGRWPVWKDAIAHCSDEGKAKIEKMLREEGLWQEPGVPETVPAGDGTIGMIKIGMIKIEKTKSRKNKK